MLPTTFHNALEAVAQKPIQDVLVHGGANSPAPKGEVDALRAMVVDGFAGVAAEWAPILASNGLRINFSSVFCHSSPQVTFLGAAPQLPYSLPLPRQCELADLLIVIDHRPQPHEPIDRRAVLVQAKMLKSGQLALSGRQELTQHELLTRLPTFNFASRDYDPRPRTLARGPFLGMPPTLAQYGGIDLKVGGVGWWHALSTLNPAIFQQKRSLARYLSGMAVGLSGYARKATVGGRDDWSFTVDELLRVTYQKMATVRGIQFPRGHRHLRANIQDLTLAGGDGGTVPRALDRLERPEGGISTIRISVSSLDDDWT